MGKSEEAFKKEQLTQQEYEEQLNRMHKKSQRRTIAIVIVMILLFLMLFFYMRGCQNHKEEELKRDAAAKTGIMPGMTDAEIQERLNRMVKDSEVNVSMNAQPVLKDGVLNVAIENIPANKFAFRVKVVMDESKKTLFETDIIDPDHYIETLKIKDKWRPGAYDATATFTCYNPKSLQKTGVTGVKIVVLVPGVKEEP
ncbi:MAG: hypothetical protein RR275_00550 [Lachnospiraceae bacterium]